MRAIKIKSCIVLLCFVAVAGFYSCKKNTGPPEPVITLTLPTDTTIINAGDTVELKWTISDNKSLHEVFFTLAYAADSTVIFSDNPYTHGAKSRNFSYTWITSSTPAAYNLLIEVQDHDHHLTKQEFPILVH